MYALVMEDDSELLDLLAGHFVPSIMGCDSAHVVGRRSVGELAKLNLMDDDDPIVLVTDGNLLDGTCADVVAYVIGTFGAARLRGRALLLSANPKSDWDHVFAAARSGGIELSYRQKPFSPEDIESWWNEARFCFLGT